MTTAVLKAIADFCAVAVVAAFVIWQAIDARERRRLCGEYGHNWYEAVDGLACARCGILHRNRK